MSNEDHNWEFGIRDDGHSVITEADTKPVVLGEGKFQYEVSGLNWGNLPEGWVYKEATAVDVDSKDRVYAVSYTHLRAHET